MWAITPHDARFTTRQNLDEAVQHLLGKPGLRWGTLQALDSHSMQRVIEWLSQATLPAQRQKRLGTLKSLLRQELSALMRSYLAPLVEEPATPTRTGRKHGAHPAKQCRPSRRAS